MGLFLLFSTIEFHPRFEHGEHLAREAQVRAAVLLPGKPFGIKTDTGFNAERQQPDAINIASRKQKMGSSKKFPTLNYMSSICKKPLMLHQHY